MKPPYRLSVVMMIQDEALHLAQLLPLLKRFADEIILLDSGSTDDSEAIARQHGVQWHQNTDWQGFGIQRQRAQALASGDWILALDADEYPDEDLIQALQAIKSEAPGQRVYGLRRQDFAFGGAIDVPGRHLKAHWRLYPRRFGFNGNRVHESLILDGAETAILPGYLRHQTAASPQFWLQKRFRYAEDWARQRAEAGQSCGLLRVIGHSLGAFFKQYFIDRRFLCGLHGWVYAWLFTQYTWTKYALLYDFSRPQKRFIPDIQPLKSASFPHSLSVAMMIKNEAHNLPETLNSLGHLPREVVLLDSGSTDESETIARQYGAQWHQNTDWRGFGMQRQRVQALCSGDYVLALDADERLNEALRASIAEVLQQPPSPDVVYALSLQSHIAGRRIHAWYRDRMLRLYPRQHFQYHPYEVHESLNAGTARVVTLRGCLQHQTAASLAQFLGKNIRYAREWGEEQAQKGRRPKNLWILPLLSLWGFLREYLIRGAFYGGAHGYFAAGNAFFYHFDKYLILAFQRRGRL